MKTAYVMLGKIGDIISILPILRKKFEKTGEKQVLVVSKDYAAILEACSYVEADVFDADFRQLRGAVVYAKRKYDEVVVLQVYGEDFQIQRRTPSFVFDQWARAGLGVAKNFTEWPLVFDRRNREREKALLKKHGLTGGNCILIADSGESSPFPNIDGLLSLLAENFQNHKLIRLSQIRAENFVDFLAVYEQAQLLVATETAHLHLARASNIPAIALATDTPSRWHGTPWHPRYGLHMRYSDFFARKDDLVSAARDLLLGRTVNVATVEPEPIQTGYNPSHIVFGGEKIKSFRYHPDASWRTEIAISDSFGTTKLQLPEEIALMSNEDMRLFVHNGKLHGSWTVGRDAVGRSQSVCVVVYGELVREGARWSVKKFFRPRYDGNDWTGMQKNWSFFEHEGRLFASYRKAPTHTVIELSGEKVVNFYNTDTPKWGWGEPRGGTPPIPYNGAWLQFFHAQTRNERSDVPWCYHIGAMLVEPKPPFKILKLSSKPIATATEQWFPNWHRWKPKVLIPYGVIMHHARHLLFELSVGINDSACATMLLDERDLNL